MSYNVKKMDSSIPPLDPQTTRFPPPPLFSLISKVEAVFLFIPLKC